MELREKKIEKQYSFIYSFIYFILYFEKIEFENLSNI